MGGLLRANLRTHREKVAYSDNLGTPTAKLDRHIRGADIRVRSTIFLSGRKRMMVVSESGDSLFGGLDIKVGNDGLIWHRVSTLPWSLPFPEAWERR